MTLPSFELPQPIDGLDSNPFHAELYRDGWFEHLAEKYEVADRYGDFVLHEKRVAKGLLTVRELKFYAGHTAWFQDFTEERVAAFEKLSSEVKWDYFYMVWAGSRDNHQSWERLGQLGYPLLHGWAMPMHLIDLSTGYDGYLARRNSKDRYNIRQKLKMAAKAKSELFRYDQFEEIEPFFEKLFKLHVPYWQEKTGYSFFANPAEQAFTVAWAKALYKTGQLRLHGLKLNGEIANLSFSFLEGDTLCWMLTINTGHDLELYPGMVSLYLRMQEAAQEGARLFNMGYGAMPYKLQTQTHEDPRNVLVVINPRSLKGQIFKVFFQYKNRKQEIAARQ
jgi:hypothetical protein